VPALALILLALGCIGIGAYRQQLWLLDPATPALGQGLVFVALLGGTLAETRIQRRRLRRELGLERLASARIEGELAAAHHIQMGILPAAASLAPDPRFDLAAALTPARQVGGDLYDFFLIDADHLLLAIGDVSGKGVPASLFMALAKAFLESNALRSHAPDISEVVRRADREISRENPEAMFVTLFAGILDLATGELRFCNAGHDAPFIARAGAPAHRLTSVGGPPLCVVDVFPYATESYRLEGGEILCLVTDGVTEATNRAGEMLGSERTAAALGVLPAGSRAADAIAHLRALVDGFLAGADPSDDVTLLAVRWTGSAASASTDRPNEP
jgi:serine phosphatase RsbU (regulator of sigma subunit)